MKNLFEPLEFRGGATARNRVVLAPLTNSQSHDDGTLSEDELRWLDIHADGGFGVVTTCASHVSRDGQGWPGELGCFDDSHLPGLKRIATSLKARGALSLVQLFHGGLRANAALIGGAPWSASAGPEHREATEADIQRVIADFAAAAGRCLRAGMDGVEIHGAHGYLLTQFLSTVENRRTDAWGGSLENRARLLREVVRAVRTAAPTGFVVGVRLSPEDFGNAKGMDLDESLQVARWLADEGADFIHLSLWEAHRNTTKRPDQHAASLFRQALPSDVRILVAGKIWTRAEAETVLALGADAVALGRSAIANPDWPLRAVDPAWQPVKPPLSEQQLLARGLSPGFVQYMRRWKGFVE